MRQKFASGNQPSPRRRAALIAFCLLLLVGAVALGQSGRKQKKADPLPPVQGVPSSATKDEKTPEPEPQPEPEKKVEIKRRVVVVSDTASFDVSMISMNVARQACVDELRRGAGRDVNIQDGGSMTRGEAMKAAKNDDLTYYAFLEARTMSASSGQAELNYVIFAPKSGKISGTGIGLPVQSGVINRPPIAASRYDYAWELCGRDAARQIAGRLDLSDPRRP
jgi:hypothetical protein